MLLRAKFSDEVEFFCIIKSFLFIYIKMDLDYFLVFAL
jgi:hypothetical protein